MPPRRLQAGFRDDASTQQVDVVDVQHIGIESAQDVSKRRVEVGYVCEFVAPLHLALVGKSTSIQLVLHAADERLLPHEQRRARRDHARGQRVTAGSTCGGGTARALRGDFCHGLIARDLAAIRGHSRSPQTPGCSPACLAVPQYVVDRKPKGCCFAERAIDAFVAPRVAPYQRHAVAKFRDTLCRLSHSCVLGNARGHRHDDVELIAVACSSTLSGLLWSDDGDLGSVGQVCLGRQGAQ